MATLYFNGAVDNDWATLGNWWQDSNHTIPATSLPTSSDDVIATADISSNSGSEPTVANFTLNDPNTVYPALGISITVTGNCNFNDGSFNKGIVNSNATFNGNSTNYTGTVNGNATFNGNSTNYNGTVNGNVTFNDYSGNNSTVNGDCIFNDNSINNGTITGDCNFNYYSINNGTITGDCIFNHNSWNNITITGDCNFNYSSGNNGTVNGDCNFNYYSINNGTVNGDATFNNSSNNNATMFFNCTFNDYSFNSGVLYGNATFNNNSYNNGTVYGTVTYNGLFGSVGMSYYIGGQLTTLDVNGNGFWIDTYYINGVKTTLDNNGNGCWNNVSYTNGVADFDLTNYTGYNACSNKPTLLLHFDGADGSSNFVDSSSNALTVTAHGNATISTSQSKFGGASGYFDGVSYLSTADDASLGLGTGDFTVEWWARTSTLDNHRSMINIGTYATGIFVRGMSEDNFYIAGESAHWEADNLFPVGQWTHFAVVRNAGVNTLYVNGTSAATVTRSADLGNSAPAVIGVSAHSHAEVFSGYIDELRIVKGKAIYTTDFTPPTAPFTSLGAYYINGAETTLDQNGSGCWNNIGYLNGNPRTGINGSSILGIL